MRKICVVTGTRAEYGLLRWVLQEIVDDPQLKLQLIVTGSHLDPASGNTWREIVDHGFEITEKLDMLLSGDSPTAVTKSIGIATIGFAGIFERLQPDILLILGDRYEILSAAQAAMVARIPIAHIHGGETTEGAIDEAIRHAITKMSHIHCVAAAPYARRVMQMGESSSSVHIVGAPGLDTIEKIQLWDQASLEQDLGYKLGARHLLVTFHPVTLSGQSAEASTIELLSALDHFSDATITITGANADPTGRQVNTLLEKWVQSRINTHFTHSLGQVRYLSLAKQSAAVIGNSSSGLIEIPSLGRPTVNIGDRQKSRLRANSVIDCNNSAAEIIDSISTALTPEFQAIAKQRQNPYGQPGSAKKIVAILRDTRLDGILFKHFHDSEIQP